MAMINIVFFFCLFLSIHAEFNCSTEDRCGSNGYCVETGDVASCQCRFWWTGEFCNEQSSSGKEVIALGSITATLILAYYALNIGRKIYKKRKQPKEATTKEVSTDPKLVHVAIKHVRESCPASSYLVAVLVIIIAAANLLIKWVQLKKLHTEVTDRYHKNESIYYNRSSFCEVLDIEYINVITFPVAVLVVGICIAFNQRASLARYKCRGYIAPPIPVDFLSHIDRSFAMVVFALIANDLLGIVIDDSNSSDKSIGVLVKFLLRVLKVVLMGFRFYPILICAYMRYTIPLVAATLYAWLDHAISIVDASVCSPLFYSTYEEFELGLSDTDLYLAYFGDGVSLLAIEVCIDIPEALCLAYISVKLPMMFIARIRSRQKANVSTEKKMSELLSREEKNFLRIAQPGSVEMLYVQNLFRSANDRPRSQSFLARLIPKRIYEWRDDFRFSSRVLCVYSSIFLLLFFVTVRICVNVLPILQLQQDLMQTTLDIFITAATKLDDAAQEDAPSPVAPGFPLPNLWKTFLYAVALTLVIMVIQLTVMLVNIRRNLLQAYRGDDSEIPRRKRSEYVSYALGNFHFAGYFIGFLVWGFIIIATFSTIVCVCVAAFIVFDKVRFLELIIKGVTPPLLVFLFKRYLNTLLAQYVFMQHCGDVLALNNRRCLMIFLYFNFYLDAFLGLVSSIFRLIKSVIGGVFYMCRLDYSPLGRKLEHMDGGFSAYCGFIHTECTHRHPVMLVFVSQLYNEVKKRDYLATHPDSDNVEMKKATEKLNKPSIYLRKWRLAAYLVRNPAIVFFRKRFLKGLSRKDLQAINDLDNDQRIDTLRGAVFYTRQMAGQRPNFVSDTDSTQPIIIKF